AANSSPTKTGDECATDERDAKLAVRHPNRTDGIGEIGRHEHSAQSDHGDGEKPEIPRHHESGKLVETEFCPLVNTAFERHQAVQINHDRRLRNVKEQNREQPKEEMRWP